MRVARAPSHSLTEAMQPRASDDAGMIEVQLVQAEPTPQQRQAWARLWSVLLREEHPANAGQDGCEDKP
jgi:hypothetical protein